MSLFVLSSKDGWVNIMYDGLDAVGIDQQVRGWGPSWLTLNKGPESLALRWVTSESILRGYI